MNRHVHLHACVTDGVFTQSSDGYSAKFFPARPITTADLATLTERVRRRVVRWFRMQRLIDADAATDMVARKNSGVSVDASVRITLIDRDVPSYFQSLEHLVRYCARPPFALERLAIRRGKDGRIAHVRYVLPRHKAATWVGPGRGRKSTRPGANGVVELSPFEFLDRLADLVPPPRKHRHRYHRVFAPNHKLRPAVTALAIGNSGTLRDAATGGHAVGGHAAGGDATGHGCDSCDKLPSHDTSRIAWAKLMARVGEEFLRSRSCSVLSASAARPTPPDYPLELGWRTRHRTRPDRPVRLIYVEAKPHESYRGMRGPDCDGVLRLVTNRLDLPAELIAEMYRLRWVIEMFFRTFKQLLGCGHLFSDKHNGVEIQAYCAMIVCMLILIYTGEKPNRAMYQMVSCYLIGLASLKELEAFIKSRKASATAEPWPWRHMGFAAARSVADEPCSFESG